MSQLELVCSRNFMAWLTEQRIGLAFTTHQAGRLFLLGAKPNGQLSGFERSFDRSAGLWSDGQTIWLTSRFQIWRLENVLLPGQTNNGYDRLYVPQVGYVTGDVDVHDIAVSGQAQVTFVNTLFGCLATVDERFSFRPLWQPPFITKLAAEDRCHLNGLAMVSGEPKYVTVCSQSDVVDGWRESRVGGGCILDVPGGNVICNGLSMPHSPRFYRNRLWVLDSGTGFFGFVDRGEFEPITFLPGYARGLTFTRDYAVIGLSKCRRERTFAGLPLEANLHDRKSSACCGLFVVDLNSGDIVHWIKVEGVIEELSDVVTLPGAVRPKALGFKTDEIDGCVWLEHRGQVERWTGRP